MKYISVNSWTNISLHDCGVTKVERNKNILTLYFDDGFWITPNNELNVYDKTIKSDKTSFLKITGVDAPNAIWSKSYSKEETHFHKIHQSNLFENLLIKINSDEWDLEIINEIHEFSNEVTLECYLNFEYAPYHTGIIITLKFEKFSYCWNTFLFDRTW